MAELHVRELTEADIYEFAYERPIHTLPGGQRVKGVKTTRIVVDKALGIGPGHRIKIESSGSPQCDGVYVVSKFGAEERGDTVSFVIEKAPAK
jgi:hypothetical protein